MFTRTRKSEETQELSGVIRIPKNITEDIEERGFHLYKWISPDEVKLSIERDFLKVLKIGGIPLAIISVLCGLISGLNPLIFLLSIFIGVSIMFIYLLLLSIQRSRLLTKSAFVVMTDSSISLGGKVHKLSDISGLKKDLEVVSETFEEDLFGESKLSNSKKSLSEEVVAQLFGGYKKIFDIGDNRHSFGRSKDSAQLLLALIALYTIYIAIMACVYFFGVLGLLVFGKLLIWANTKYLIYRGHSVIKINELFGKLDISSQEIKEQKTNLKTLLNNAYKNEWKDGLLLEINSGIKNINTSAQNAVVEFLSLKNEITTSRYSDMFSFEVYNGWMKKQISKPLKDILALLEKNKAIILETKENIKTQIEGETKPEYIAALKLQLKRLKIQLLDINRYIPELEESINKLS